MKVSVEQIQGMPAAIITKNNNQRIFKDIQFNTYVYDPSQERSHYLIKQMADNGTKTFGFVVNLAQLPQVWTKPLWTYKDGRDFVSINEIKKRIDLTRTYCKEAKFVIRIFMGVPKEWIEDNRDERVVTIDENNKKYQHYAKSITVNEDNYYVSMASDCWRKKAGSVLKQVIEEVERNYGDSVIAYCISGLSSEEWYHYSWHNQRLDDYSIPFTNSYRQWLKKKYKKNEVLQKAWNQDNITFNTVHLPSYEQRISKDKSTFYNPLKEQDIIDFYRFYNYIIPDTILYFIHCVKEVVPHKLVGCLYGYQLEFGEICSGHNGLHYLLEDDQLDYILIETGYMYRFPGKGGDNFRCPYSSFKLNNKLLINDNDTVTYKFEEIYHDETMKELYRKQLGYAKNAELSAEVQKRIIGFAACHGMTTTYFDLHGGYYDDPIILQGLREAEEVYSKSFQLNRESAAEVLVIVDEDSDFYVRVSSVELGNPLLKLQHTSLVKDMMKLGAPYDCILLKDIDKIQIQQYKLVIVHNLYQLNKEEIKSIERLKSDGRVIIWNYAPGYITEKKMGASQVSQLIDMDIEEMADEQKLCLSFENIKSDLGNRLDKALKDEGKKSIETDFCAKSFQVVDSHIKTVAKNYYQPNQITAAYKNVHDTYISFYMLSTALGGPLLKEIAKYFGVNIYSNKQDTVYANQSLVVIHAIDDGYRTIEFPKVVKKVINPITNQIVSENIKKFELNAKEGHTYYFLVEKF